MNLNLTITDDGAVDRGFLATLNDRMRQIQSAFKSLSGPATSACLQGNHANRLTQNAASLAPGTQFWESDRFSIYIVRNVGKAGSWAWAAGFYANTLANRPNDLGPADDGFVFYATDTQALYVFSGGTSTWRACASTTISDTFANRPTGLTSGNAGLLFHCTTGTAGVAYNHTFEWSGTAWTVAERERLGGYFADYAKAPTEPGWQLANGSSTHYLELVAGALTEVAITLPDLTGGVYRKGGTAYTGTVNAKGTITLGGATGQTTAGTPAGTLAGGIPSSTTGVPGGTGTAVVVASNIHTHTETFTGTALPTHSHTLDPATSTATATFTADPVANLAVLPYFRR